MKSITFNREELYNQLWEKPMTKIAKDYNISLYQLTKVCDELEIPRPESGYWSKLLNGYKIKQKPLTEFKTNEYKLVLYNEPKVDLKEQLPKSFKTITFKKNLTGLHPLVRKTYKYLKEDRYGDNYGRLKPFGKGYLGILVSNNLMKRAILFYDGLIKELERQGFQVAGEGSHKVTYTSVKIGEEKIYLRLEEAGSYNRTKAKSESSWNEYDYEYYTTGKLRLQISKFDSNYTAKTISDTDDLKLEYQIEKIFNTILLTAEEAKKWRIKREQQEKRYEQLRIIRERQQREQQLENQKRADLEQASTSFTTSQYIYAYIQEVETQLLANTLSVEQFQKFVKWKKWALKHADRLNPVKQKIESFLQTDTESATDPNKLKLL
ncbi:hypothetical protein [Gracilimonas amylolytica]|uniref:hypothetical protein n=1 Tax=Gracilimonas amylolytica TaxID=1749045 RepID=UPI000CD8BA82|nr:hypothetical protein [Gracilimonas amylolytica]